MDFPIPKLKAQKISKLKSFQKFIPIAFYVTLTTPLGTMNSIIF